MSKAKRPQKAAAPSAKSNSADTELAASPVSNEAEQASMGQEEEEETPTLDAAVEGNGVAAEAPNDPWADATGDGGDPLPYGNDMEAAFGDVSGLTAHTGKGEEMDALGGNAGSKDGDIAFADDSPSKELVAEEVAHSKQGDANAAEGSVSSGNESAEGEARGAAKQAAVGQKPEPMKETRSADIHLNNEKGKRRGKTVSGGSDTDSSNLKYATTEFGKFEIHPDPEGFFAKMGFALKTAEKEGYTVIAQSDFTEKKQANERLVKARTAILGYAKTAKTESWCETLNRAMNAIPQADREALHADPVFLNDPIWQSKPELLVTITNKLDPLFFFAKDLGRAWEEGKANADFVKTWAGSHAGSCERALTDASVLGVMGAYLTAKDFALATQYLMGKGQLPDDARSRMQRALEAGDDKEFRVAWTDVCSDATLLASYQNDANFLMTVESKMPTVIFDLVRTTLEGGVGGANESYELLEDEKGLVDTAAAKTSKALWTEFDAYWCEDAAVLSALNGFFSAVDALLSAVTDEKQKAAKTEQARDILKQTYLGYYGKSINHGICAGMSGGDKKEALALVKSQEVETGPSKEGEGEGSSLPLKMTDEEKKKLARPLETAIKTMRNEFDSYWCEDAVVTGAIDTYDAAVKETITNPDEKDPNQRPAMISRRNDARSWLDREYQGRYGESLQSAIAGGMSGNTATKASGFFARAEENELPPVESDTYTEEMSDSEKKRALDAGRKGAGILNAALDVMFVDDAQVHAAMSTAQMLMRNSVHPMHVLGPKGNSPTGDDARFFLVKTRLAMVTLKEAYDAQYGSLVGELHDCVDDSAVLNFCLMAVGDRGGANNEAIDAAVGNSKDPEKFGQMLVTFDLQVNALAARFADELYDSGMTDWVGDDAVASLCKSFTTMKQRFSELPELSEDFNEDSYLEYLNRAYLPLGGSLAQGIQAGLDPKNAEDALKELGLGSFASATVKRDEELAEQSSEAADAKQEITPILSKLFYVIEDLPASVNTTGSLVAAGIGNGIAGPVGGIVAGGLFAAGSEAVSESERPERWAMVMAGLMQVAAKTMGLIGKMNADGTAVDRVGMVLKTYEEIGSIGLAEHIGLIASAPERKQVEGLFPIKVPALAPPTKEDLVGSIKEVQEQAQDPNNHEYDIDQQKCSPGFTIEMGMQRAGAINAALTGFDMNFEYTLTKNLAGFAEDNRIVRKLYKKAFGVDMEFHIKSRFGENRSDDAERYKQTAKTGGVPTDWATELESLISAGDLNELYRQVYLADPDQREQALAEPNTLYKVKTEFGEEAYDRVYRSLTGQLNLGDMLRTRDEGTEWYTFGFGTDEEGTESDIKLFFEKFKKDVEYDLRQAGEKDKESIKTATTEQAKEKARQAFNDPDVVAMLEGEFSSDELLKMQQFVMGAGERSGTDEVYADMKGLGTGDEIIAHIKKMTDSERESARTDPTFLAWITGDMQGTELQEALNILNSKQGEDGLAEIENGLNSGTFSTDEKKIFDGVLSMNPADLQKLANDPIRIAKIRMDLDNTPDELQMFDEMMKEAKLIQQGGDGVDGNLGVNDITQKSQHLVFKHTFALKTAVYEGKDATLAAAQKCYTEKKDVQQMKEDKTSMVEVFGDTQRGSIWSSVDKLITVELAQVPGWMEALAFGVGGPIIGGVLNDVQKAAAVDAAAEYSKVIEKAVMGKEDPSAFRLKEGITGADNDDAINGALENVSTAYLAANWTNICEPGDNGPSMKSVYETYILAKNKHTGAPEDAALKEQFMIAKRNFALFPLDVSKSLATTLKDEGMMGIDEKAFLDFKGKVRPKILALTSADISAALGGSYQAVLDDKGATDEEKAQATQMKDSLAGEADMLDNETRDTVSQHAYDVDTYDHQRGQVSALDGMTDDYEKVDNAMTAYSGELGESVEADFESGDVGTIDEDEMAKLKERKGAFDRSVTEYKAAKAAMADLFKYIAIAIITAVATILTGPGGATLGAVLLTAAAQATVTALIDEAFLGNDFDLAMDGGKRVLVETLSAAATFGMGKGFDAVVKKVPFLSNIGNKFDAIEAKLLEGADEGLGGMMLHSAYKSTMDTATKPFKDMPGDIIGMVDLGKMKYFDSSLGNHMGKEMEKKFDAMPNDLAWEWINNFGGNMADHAGKKTFKSLKGEEDPEVLGGVASPTGGQNDKEGGGGPSFMDMVGKGAKDTFASADAITSVYTQAFGVISSKVQAGTIFKTSGWDESEIGAFASKWMKGRGSKLVNNVAGQVKDERNKGIVDERYAELEADLKKFSEANVPEHMRGAAGANMKAWLMQTGSTDFAAWESGWKEIQGKVEANISGMSNGDAIAYSRWLFASPDGVEDRLKTPAGEVVSAITDAKKQMEAMQNSPAFGAMDQEQQEFYLTTLDSGNMVTAKYGDASSKVKFDLTKPEDAAKFEASYIKTKVGCYKAFSTSVTDDWTKEEKDAWTAHLETADVSTLPSLNPTNEVQMEVQVSVYAAAFKASQRNS